MKNIQIGAALKTMRKNRGWTIHDVVVQLNDLYNIAVAEKTVYGMGKRSGLSPHGNTAAAL